MKKTGSRFRFVLHPQNDQLNRAKGKGCDMGSKRGKTFLTLLFLLATPIAAEAWERGKVERFATLPAGEAHPEGICVGPDGNIYVVTVAANKPLTSPGSLIVFDPDGKH